MLSTVRNMALVQKTRCVYSTFDFSLSIAMLKWRHKNNTLLYKILDIIPCCFASFPSKWTKTQQPQGLLDKTLYYIVFIRLLLHPSSIWSKMQVTCRLITLLLHMTTLINDLICRRWARNANHILILKILQNAKYWERIYNCYKKGNFHLLY